MTAGLHDATAPPPPVLVRDRLTGASYGGLALYAYLLYSLGPLLPLLRDDLGLSYSMMSLHSAVFASGAILTNPVFERLRLRHGYRPLFWGAAACLAVGGLLLGLGTSVALTLPTAALAGIGGSLLQTTVLAILSEHHGHHPFLRERSLVEANAGASASALAAPLAVGGLQAAGAGWRWSLLVPTLVAVALFAAFRHDPLRPRSPGTGAPPGEPRAADGPPRAFWTLAALCGVVVGAEFCLVFYGAPQLTEVAGLTTGQAATAMSAFYGGTLAGRLVGSRLATAAGRRSTSALVLAALSVSGAGYLVLWSATTAWAALAGLCLSGLGLANLFPLTLSLAVSAAPGAAGRATARVQLLVSLAIVTAPLLLGSLSDLLGVRPALGVAALLVPLAALLLLLGRRAHSRPPEGIARP